MDYVIALVPPVGLLVILVVIVRAFLGADRSERAAEKKFREAHPDLDLAPLPPGRSSVAGALAAEEARSGNAEADNASGETGNAEAENTPGERSAATGENARGQPGTAEGENAPGRPGTGR